MHYSIHRIAYCSIASSPFLIFFVSSLNAIRYINYIHDMAEEKEEGDAAVSPRPTKSTGMKLYGASLLAALYYVSISVSLTLFNKILFQRHSVSPVLVLLSQCVVTIVVLNLISILFGVKSTVNLTTLSPVMLCTHLPLVVSYVCMLLFGMIALAKTSLLMYHTLRRTSIIPVLLLQWHFTRTPPTMYTLAAVAIIITGGTGAIANNLRWEPLTYVLAFSANITTAFYLTRLKSVRDKLGLTNLQLLFLNNVFTFPILISLFLGSPTPILEPVLLKDPVFIALFLSSSTFAIALNHAVYVNTSVNDPVGHTISTQVKDAVLLVFSIFVIDDPKYRSTGMVVGAMVEFSGSIVFAIGKILKLNKETALAKIEKSKFKPQAEEKKQLLKEEDGIDK